MRVACLGGGPAGIYFAISMKLRNPAHDVHVFERNKAGDTFGWGVVFSDQTLANLTRNDAVSAETISASFAHWDDIEVNVSGESSVSSGHGFIGIGRLRLLQILQDRARELGVTMHFETSFETDLSAFADFDLIVAADGVNSAIRTAHAERFKVDIQTRTNKFMWLGTPRLFDAFAFIFEKTEAGWIWAHAYRFDESRSTFIIECAPETWDALGFETMSQDESIALCERIFARHLKGEPLLTNAAHLRGSAAWINFRRVLCEAWSFDNVVLLGDAAHTAHFSIGSGTKLALEDAIKLAAVMDRPDIEDPAVMRRALAEYQEERHVEVLKIQNSARNSTEWFETLDRYIDFDLAQFAYSLLTRSQRVSHENLRIRDSAWLGGVERWFWEKARGDASNDPAQPMFAPFSLRGMTVPNRVVVAPMLTYSADDRGNSRDFHMVHYGSRALGGAGLILTEMLAISPDGRATPACPGLYADAHVPGWRAINDFIHGNSATRTCAQIGHAGARAACAVPDGAYDVPLDAPWPILSASPKPWKRGGTTPKMVTEADMERIAGDFVAAARRADRAGFDMIEVQAGHGFLLSSFITPVMNDRRDAFGGSLEKRLRFPLTVIEAVRREWPDAKPMAVRLSAHDWVGEQGITPADAVEIARRLKAIGIDLIDVSAGETAPEARPVYGRMFQTPFADRIRNEAGIATMAVGNITDQDQVNSILTAGRADLVALGRPHLIEGAWTLHAAANAGQDAVFVPPPYRLGQKQSIHLHRKAQDMVQA